MNLVILPILKVLTKILFLKIAVYKEYLVFSFLGKNFVYVMGQRETLCNKINLQLRIVSIL